MYPAALNVNDARKALQYKGLSGHRVLGSAVVIANGGEILGEVIGHSSFQVCFNIFDVILYKRRRYF